jgi:alpha-methylacyl-CoA racemase
VSDSKQSAGPLAGVRVVEFAGVGPCPYAGMLLADLGAHVVKVDRIPVRTRSGDASSNFLDRGKRSICADLKNPSAKDLLVRLIGGADVLIEGFRPGVMERAGLGPDECRGVNPRLVYGRVTGWGQEGPLASAPGHDINYIAVTGALWAIGREGSDPVPPLNLLGDFAGGGLFLALGVVAALAEAGATGRGRVVDAAMVDGVASLTTWVWAMRAAGHWHDQRGSNTVDTGRPFYDVYRCRDDTYLAVGALESRFYRELVRLAGFEPDGDRQDRSAWAGQRAAWAALVRTRNRDEWMRLLEGSEACVAPVLDWREAPGHPHLASRGTFVEVAGQLQPAPAPRFPGAEPVAPGTPPEAGEHTTEVLRELGLDDREIADLVRAGAVGTSGDAGPAPSPHK